MSYSIIALAFVITQPQPQPCLQLALRILELRVFEESHRAAMKRMMNRGGAMLKFCEVVSSLLILLNVIPDSDLRL